ncbi:MAG: O-antigen ligase family protein [Ruminococcaceae bacterium]|nr:O-antigen ligase family protein [Oscillospiraceae bacterium]
MNNSIATINPQLNIQKKSHSIFLLMLGVFILLIFARTVVGITFPVVILLGWFAVTALFSDRDELLTLCILCIPTASAFQYKYALILGMVVYALKFKDDFKLNLCILPVVIMMVWELIHGLFYDLSIVELLRDFVELIFLSFMMCIKKRETDYVFLCRVFGYVVGIIVIFVLINVLRTRNYDLNALFEEGNYRFGIGNKEAENFGLNYNPNGLGRLCNCGIVSLMLLRYVKKQMVLDNVVAIILILIGGLTVSRTFILTCAAIFVVFALLGNKSGKGRIKTILITAILVLVIWFVVANFLPAVYDRFVARFSESDITGGRSGLLDIYDEHIYSSWKHALFGIGLQNVSTKMNQIYGLVTEVPHNGVQELIVVWGWPGLCMFLSMLLCVIHSAGKNVKKFGIINFVPFVFVIGTSMAGQLITAGSKLLMLSFAYITLSKCFLGEEE